MKSSVSRWGGGGRRLLIGAALCFAVVLLLPARTEATTESPIVLDPFAGLYAQFGYAPAYTRNVPAFDRDGTPYIRSRTADPHETSYVHVLGDDGTWLRYGMVPALRKAYPDFERTFRGGIGGRIVFDDADRAYTVLTINLSSGARRNVLLWSSDHCRTWHVTQLPKGEVTMESWTGHNTIEGPPLLLIEQTAGTINRHTGKYRRVLKLVQVDFVGEERLGVSVAMPVSTISVGLGGGATAASPIATRGGRSHLVWTETTAFPTRGSPVYAATYDRATRSLGRKVLIARSRPANDGHAQPGITMDTGGYLHVVAGAHGRPFRYTRSLAPEAVDRGWLAPTPTARTGYVFTSGGSSKQECRQTYLSLVCGPDDRLHIVYRQWRRKSDGFFGGSTYGALSYQSKTLGGSWGEPRVILVPPYSGYSIYNHALSLDRRGRIFLSTSCLSGPEGSARKAAMARWWQAGGDGPEPPLYLRRMVLTSLDGGTTWHFAETGDFANRQTSR